MDTAAATGKAVGDTHAKAVTEITQALTKIPGMTDLAVVEDRPGWVIWGALYDGVPYSFTANITG